MDAPPAKMNSIPGVALVSVTVGPKGSEAAGGPKEAWLWLFILLK